MNNLTTQQRLKKFERGIRESLAAPADGLPDNDLAMLIRKALNDGNDDADTLRRIRALIEPATTNPISIAAKEQRVVRVVRQPTAPAKRGSGARLLERQILESGRRLKAYPKDHERFLAALRYGR